MNLEFCMRYTLPECRRTIRARTGIASALTIALLTLAGCSSLPGTPGSGYSVGRAERLFEAGDYDAAASGWMALANGASGEQRDQYLLRAAESWLADGDRLRATAALGQVNTPPGAALANDYYLGLAEVGAFDCDPIAAEQALSRTDPQRFTLAQRARADAVRGQVLFLRNDPAGAVQLLVRRELWLGSELEIIRNDQLIWDGLLVADPDLLQTALQETVDADVGGWLALGILASNTTNNAMDRGVVAWQRNYPGHPALRSVVRGFAPEIATGGIEPEHIALLLPLSGRAGAFGSTIRDGVIAHYLERYSDMLNAPEIRVYDLAGREPVVVYEQAVLDGADLIVGPVLRQSVDALAAYTGPRVPTILLNYPSITENYSSDIYAFGLAPEDDARAAAVQAFDEGHRRAVALLPTGSRGERLLIAFNEQFTALGGTVLSYENFVPEAADHSNEIERLMLLTDSVARYRRARNLLGGPLQFEPRRREDVDVIFLGANAANARQLKPQLRFHYAGDLPVIATSSVHNPASDEPASDLNGIEFAEIPWLVDRMSGQPTPLDAVADTLTNVRRQPRLFALGHDALTLALAVYARNLPLNGISGATGHLILDDQGNFERQPGWAKFENGRPVRLDQRVNPSRDAGEAELLAPFDTNEPIALTRP